MSKLLIDETSITGLADAIRTKGGTTALLKPGDMPSTIANMSGGGGSFTIDGESATEDLNLFTEWGEDVKLHSTPYDFWQGCAVNYNHFIHILGGGNTSTTRKYFYKYTGSGWTKLTNIPYTFIQGRAVVYRGEIHILGGGTTSTQRKYHYKWNGSAWTSVGTLPIEFSNGCAVVYNDEIHIFVSTSHYKWNGSTWTSVSTLTFPFISPSAVVYKGEIHILGGETHYKWNGSTWTKASTLPYDFSAGCAEVINDELYILGGEYGSNFRYYWEGTQWGRWNDIPSNVVESYGCVYNSASTVWMGAIHILGSYESGYTTQHWGLDRVCYKKVI